MSKIVTITFSGPQGSGKTRLASLIFQMLKEKGFNQILNDDDGKVIIQVIDAIETLDKV